MNMNYPNSEKCVFRSLKRCASRDCMPDQRIKVSRHSFLPRMNGLQSLQQQSDEIHSDFPQLMEYGDSDTSQITLHNICNGAYSLPSKNIMPESLDSKWLISPLSDQVFQFPKHNYTIQNYKKTSGDGNLAHSSVIAVSQRSQQASEQLSVSKPFPLEQSFHNSGPQASNNNRCQKCAAGQPGHIQHIGQWRVMDSF